MDRRAAHCLTVHGVNQLNPDVSRAAHLQEEMELLPDSPPTPFPLDAVSVDPIAEKRVVVGDPSRPLSAMTIVLTRNYKARKPRLPGGYELHSIDSLEISL